MLEGFILERRFSLKRFSINFGHTAFFIIVSSLLLALSPPSQAASLKKFTGGVPGTVYTT